MVEGALHADTVRVASGQERRAARRADGLRDIEVRETGPLGGEAVELGCPDVFGSEAAEIAITEVVDQNQDDIRGPVGAQTGDASKQQD